MRKKPEEDEKEARRSGWGGSQRLATLTEFPKFPRAGRKAAQVKPSEATGQTTVNKKAPIHYILPMNDKVHRPL